MLVWDPSSGEERQQKSVLCNQQNATQIHVSHSQPSNRWQPRQDHSSPASTRVLLVIQAEIGSTARKMKTGILLSLWTTYFTPQLRGIGTEKWHCQEGPATTNTRVRKPFYPMDLRLSSSHRYIGDYRHQQEDSTTIGASGPEGTLEP